ncbi:MATE family efflux transporter [Cohnella terricola]|uniref:MATE family efflux transporter n=1 Tax=Cohnella terricola TaxID=1289167 RepID=A0A559JT96_9BACL|nr:MATE family efflux transporter [Cohnella terricola]TVY03103.1 MATE family efflux transporter [Cohnella terricola]
MSKTYDLRQKSIISITWPIFIEALFGMLIGTVDTMMLSSYSDEAVAAVGLANQILVVVGLIFGFVTVGTGVILNQWLGAGKLNDADIIGRAALTLNLIIGLIASVGLFIYADVFLSIFKVPDHVNVEGISYLSIVGSSVFITAINMTLGTILRCRGIVKEMMLISLALNVLHIFGNYLVLMEPFGLPNLGVEGVAASTWISRAIGMIAYLILCMRSLGSPLCLINPFRFQKRNLGLIFKLGIPSAGEHVSYNLSQVVITYLVTILGTTALTTKIYSQNLTSLVFIFSMAIGQGTQILVGHMIGANQKDTAYRSGLQSLKLALLISLAIGIFLYSLSGPLFGLFTNDTEIIQLGKQLMLFSILLEPARACNMVLISSLNAAGDVKFPVVVGLVSMWAISVPLAYVFGIVFHMGLVGIWLAFSIDEWVRAFMMLLRWKKRSWQNVDLLNSVK